MIDNNDNNADNDEKQQRIYDNDDNIHWNITSKIHINDNDNYTLY